MKAKEISNFRFEIERNGNGEIGFKNPTRNHGEWRTHNTKRKSRSLNPEGDSG